MAAPGRALRGQAQVSGSGRRRIEQIRLWRIPSSEDAPENLCGYPPESSDAGLLRQTLSNLRPQAGGRHVWLLSSGHAKAGDCDARAAREFGEREYGPRPAGATVWGGTVHRARPAATAHRHACTAFWETPPSAPPWNRTTGTAHSCRRPMARLSPSICHAWRSRRHRLPACTILDRGDCAVAAPGSKRCLRRPAPLRPTRHCCGWRWRRRFPHRLTSWLSGACWTWVTDGDASGTDLGSGCSNGVVGRL